VTGVKINTVKKWRAHLSKNEEWKPNADRFARQRHLTDADEEELARKLKENVINKSIYCPRTELSSAAKELWLEKYGADRIDIDDKMVPAFGSRWQNRFMKCHGLSPRKCHIERRPPDNPGRDGEVALFFNKMQNIMMCYDHSHVINMDETSWKVIPNNWRTVAYKGQEGVKCLFSTDQKICVTAVASISAAGDKLPLWIVLKGTTERCEIFYHLDPIVQNAIEERRLVLTHSDRGWMDTKVAKEYLTWLRRLYPETNLALVWDGCRAHENREVKEWARNECQIDLTFIPHGQTGRLQPLDSRVFGELKSRARARFNAAHVGEGNKPIINKAWSVGVLVQCWQSIEQENIIKSWRALSESDV
jgi:hypothetical protein